MAKYSDGFKARMVQRMSEPEGISASALSREVGVQQPTLSRWLQKARMVSSMRAPADGASEGQREAKSPRQWSAADKLRVVHEGARLQDQELGAFLRREGLHGAQLEEWRALVLGALSTARQSKSRQASAESKRIRELERELNRKEKALAEVAALLTLKKKAAEIWGERDDSTSAKSETRSSG